MSTVYAVIMAGGAGTRFWPASRELRPKQLLPLAGDADESLLAATVRRIAPQIPANRVYIATNARLRDATLRAVPEIDAAHVLAEPMPKNTAACIGWATATIHRRDPNAIVAVLPADHHVADEEGLRRTMARALDATRAGYIATIGVVPTRPETGYGYIETGADIERDVLAVTRFVEKPDLARAKEYVAGKKHLWNAGMFFFRAADMLRAIDEHMPDLGAGLRELDAAAARGKEGEVLAAVFGRFASISIDHGVMEKERRLAVVPGNFGWSDIGGWQTAWELAEKDAAGNALPPGAVAVDASGNLVRDMTTGDRKKIVALVGVHDLVVVDTDDALLVVPRERAQEVRAAVDALKKRGDAGRV